jgi:hypothetical protein
MSRLVQRPENTPSSLKIYIFSLMLFVVKNKELFKSNSDVHSVYTRHRTDLHPPLLHLSTSQKGVYFPETKICNHLPQNIKDLSHDIKKFKDILKHFSLWVHFTHLRNILPGTQCLILVSFTITNLSSEFLTNLNKQTDINLTFCFYAYSNSVKLYILHLGFLLYVFISYSFLLV